ncbi:hypothetical protein PHMEG_00034125 [Phytophthora megakarya]|uniref:Uncharacterized protein n=1 Tax=Phytophthora megakarya TaxID=4795 RepID=A0A225UTA6_9STRA|nr:hypothetical protein PHMEG_00034125 [Phytophthora megakarya]
MVRVRAKKKKEINQLRSERERLESNMKHQLSLIGPSKDADVVLDQEGRIRVAVRRLTLESEELRQENAKLHHKIQKHVRFWSLSSQALVTIASFSDEDPSRQTLEDARKNCPWLGHPDKGWRVHFPNGEPSFFFQPFTKSEFDAAIKHYHELTAEWEPRLSTAGQLFGWTMSHTPITRRPDNSFVTCARFTTRICCSLDDLDRLLTTSGIDEWPLLVTPPIWRTDQRTSVNTQVLQEIDLNSHVMVCNIPGKIHKRFFQLTKRQVTVDEVSGKRSIYFVATAADSKSNTQCRDAEELHREVQWILEGGHSIMFTEVNPKTVDIVYDHWAVCESELHGRHLFIRWAHYVTSCYWSEKLLIPKLLK